MSILSNPIFHDEEKAYEFVESRVWPEGPVCPHCGGFQRISKMKGKSTRIGTYKCYDCRKPFTVKIGTIFEKSHVKMHVWLQAIYLMTSSKKGISSNQLSRTLDVTLKTAWFMSHRIREAMRSGNLSPIGNSSGIVEADETFIGNKKDKPKKRGRGHKHAVLSLVERGGEVRSVHVDDVKTATVLPIIKANVEREAKIMTDEATQYQDKLNDFAGHGVVNHSANEYVRGNDHTNTIEGYFSIFKRGMKGVYQHCDERHLHRYLAEFDFRYNNRNSIGTDDKARFNAAIGGIRGKRLTYRDSSIRNN